jgi:hypothetical protein
VSGRLAGDGGQGGRLFLARHPRGGVPDLDQPLAVRYGGRQQRGARGRGQVERPGGKRPFQPGRKRQPLGHPRRLAVPRPGRPAGGRQLDQGERVAQGHREGSLLGRHAEPAGVRGQDLPGR